MSLKTSAYVRVNHQTLIVKPVAVYGYESTIFVVGLGIFPNYAPLSTQINHNEPVIIIDTNAGHD